MVQKAPGDNQGLLGYSKGILKIQKWKRTMQRVLIVEDDRALSHGITMALQAPQRQLLTAFDLSAARRQLEQMEPDLVILDLNLPDGNGLTLLQQLRTHSAVPVILLTANDLESDVVEGLAAGANDYVTKPFSLAILRARVAVQLRKQQPSVYEEGPCSFDFTKQIFQVAQSRVTEPHRAAIAPDSVGEPRQHGAAGTAARLCLARRNGICGGKCTVGGGCPPARKTEGVWCDPDRLWYWVLLGRSGTGMTAIAWCIVSRCASGSSRMGNLEDRSGAAAGCGRFQRCWMLLWQARI